MLLIDGDLTYSTAQLDFISMHLTLLDLIAAYLISPLHEHSYES